MYDGLFLLSTPTPTRVLILYSSRLLFRLKRFAYSLLLFRSQQLTNNKQTKKSDSLSSHSCWGRIVYFRRVPWRPLCVFCRSFFYPPITLTIFPMCLFGFLMIQELSFHLLQSYCTRR